MDANAPPGFPKRGRAASPGCAAPRHGHTHCCQTQAPCFQEVARAMFSRCGFGKIFLVWVKNQRNYFLRAPRSSVPRAARPGPPGPQPLKAGITRARPLPPPGFGAEQPPIPDLSHPAAAELGFPPPPRAVRRGPAAVPAEFRCCRSPRRDSSAAQPAPGLRILLSQRCPSGNRFARRG